MNIGDEERARRFEQADRDLRGMAEAARARITLTMPGHFGTPCIASVGVEVSAIVRLIAQGYASGTLRSALPGLTQQDVEQALRFAANQLDADRSAGRTSWAI